jgi:hypothetical protein
VQKTSSQISVQASTSVLMPGVRTLVVRRSGSFVQCSDPRGIRRHSRNVSEAVPADVADMVQWKVKGEKPVLEGRECNLATSEPVESFCASP